MSFNSIYIAVPSLVNENLVAIAVPFHYFHNILIISYVYHALLYTASYMQVAIYMHTVIAGHATVIVNKVCT